MISKKVRIPLYGGSLFVMIADDYEKEKNELHKDWQPERNDFMGHSEGNGNTYVVILNKKYIRNEIDLVSIIAHEADHITSFIFKRVGIKLDLDNDEPHAYLLGYLVEQIYKIYINNLILKK